MRGDFSSLKNDPSKQFTRVMMQQGRPQLDADWNEQAAIVLHFLRSLTRDLIGPYAGPVDYCGFRIITEGDAENLKREGWQKEAIEDLLGRLEEGQGDFLIGPGRYYIDGIPCVNEHFVAYSDLVDFDRYGLEKKKGSTYLIYLDAWERHITFIEDNSIPEPALGGVDTCSRAKLVWRIGALELKGADYDDKVNCMKVKERWHEIVQNWEHRHRGLLRARTVDATEAQGIEAGSRNGRYRGPTNQLYRVEVHHGGSPEQGGAAPTFKVSRENGSVIFPITGIDGSVVALAQLGRDGRSSVKAGDWVEVSDDDYELERRAEPLLQVGQVNVVNRQVILEGTTISKVGQDPSKHPILRRWDHRGGDPRRGGLELREGAAIIKESEHDGFWLNLEDGIQIQFRRGEHKNIYRTGDYWLIPARAETSDVEWPRHGNEPHALPPQGVDHHYAPLAILVYNGKVLITHSDCRLKFRLEAGF
jgi:hypothetical protein